jgi:hypothetical protein
MIFLLLITRFDRPDPASPYVLKMYTSHYLYPFIIEAGGGLSTTLPIPFDPGTQYGMSVPGPFVQGSTNC